MLLAIAALAFIGIFVFDIDFPWIVLAAAILGAIGGKLMPAKFKAGGGHGASNKAYGPAIIDDDTPPPAHAKFTWGKLDRHDARLRADLGGCACCCCAGVPDLYNMGEFFTKAAFLTIGGAYAVLPYVYQGAVEHFGWLTGPQMMDGLALGETTPGPLIMIVTWVGYMGGVTKDVLANPIAAGLAGATVATFFTFLPSFLFIIAGGPMVEATRGELKFTAPLTAITAAVVGVILNLAVFFAWHTFWPKATAGRALQRAVRMAAGDHRHRCFVALWKYKADIMKVIGVCALLGLVYSLVM